MVLADPGLVIAQRVEPLDQFEIAPKREGRIVADPMEGGEKYTEAQAAMGHVENLSWNLWSKPRLAG
jgi:hypothetical protein